MELTCKFCDGYGQERCSHCDDGHVECSFCDGTGGNSLAIDVPAFKRAAKGLDWILRVQDGFAVIGRKDRWKEGKEVRYADFVFTSASGGLKSLLEDLA
jgi:hypothetical protein